MKRFRLIIPTRDSAKWIGLFLQGYRDVGLEPLYIVDSRSADDTAQVLDSMKADVRLFTPRADFAEAGMVEFGSREAASDWILRLDDDEFPSKALLAWVEQTALGSSCDCWAISRRDLYLESGRLVYSRWPTLAGLKGSRRIFNPQLRLFRPKAMDWLERVHSPGFSCPRHSTYAPSELFFVHFNNLLRSPAERLAKVRTYARYDAEMAWRVAYECLPELTDAEAHDFASDSLEEFTALLSSLPLPESADVPELTSEEQWVLYLSSQRWLAASARGWQQEAVALRQAMSSQLALLPVPTLKLLAEACMTVGRAIRAQRLQGFGEEVWELKNTKQRMSEPL